ncbi:hypothetical protein PHMEG_0009712 [Phytophthora megakarya]|uniref:Uncharacterized protein n=1 Tax=Phytophthora megakarya TaxID=4795 RepID=A0A225WFI3_9STRA|nr:hypothetical protein PHMEG_0009712 [Phytophthora megakarya]
MLTTLCPPSINEKKFSRWPTRIRARGLDWDTELRCVSMPEEKVTTALLRVQAMFRRKSATRTQLGKLLGGISKSCVFVCSLGKTLFQRIASLHRRAPHWGSVAVHEGAILDLQWFHHLRSVPLKFFREFPASDVHLYMDASEAGLCVIHPARREYIRLTFDELERRLILQGRFSINIREQLCAVLTILCWGRYWNCRVSVEVMHVRCWIDNRSAVAWFNNLNSRDPLAQELNRVLGAIEAQWALHLPGVVNTIADLGSRASDGPRLTNRRSLTKAWLQVPISNAIRKIYSARWSAFRNAPSMNHPVTSTKEPDSSGKYFVRASECQGDFHNTTQKLNPYYWLSSPLTTGPEEINTAELLQAPFNLNYAISAGIIGHLPDSSFAFDQTTHPPLRECIGRAQQRDDEEPPRDQCCNGLSTTVISKNPSTAFSQGLRYWAIFCTPKHRIPSS